MPPVALAPLIRTCDPICEETIPLGRTPVERIQSVLAEASKAGQVPTITEHIAADAEVLVERLRKLRARGGALAELALGPAFAALHVQARLAGM